MAKQKKYGLSSGISAYEQHGQHTSNGDSRRLFALLVKLQASKVTPQHEQLYHIEVEHEE